MKKEDITRILEGVTLTDAQVKSLLDLNSADITHALGKQKENLDAANAQLAEAKGTIAELEKNRGDTDALQKQIDAYRAAEEKRAADEKAASERAELLERMDAVMGDKKFIHERMRDLVAEDFKAALGDKANRGKSDREVFDAITRDQGYFANQSAAQISMPHMESVEPSKITTRDSFFKLSFADQTAFKQAHPNEFNQLFHNQGGSAFRRD